MNFAKKLEGFLLVIAIFVSIIGFITFDKNVHSDMQNNIQNKDIAAFVG